MSKTQDEQLLDGKFPNAASGTYDNQIILLWGNAQSRRYTVRSVFI